MGVAQRFIGRLRDLDDVALAGAADGDPIVFDAASGGAKRGNSGFNPASLDAPVAGEKARFDGSLWVNALDPTNQTPQLLGTPASGDQGLTSDNVHLYWGHNVGTGVNGAIYKIDPTDFSVVATFTGPPHAAGGEYRANRGTLLFSSGGTEAPVVWEINPDDGTKIRSWDFTGVDYAQGALVAWDDTVAAGDIIYLFTSNSSSNFKIRKIQIADDGTYTDLGLMFSSTGTDVPQDLCCRAGKLYFLADHRTNARTNARIIRRYIPSGGVFVIESTWMFLNTSEVEGLCFHDDTLIFGDGGHNIYTAGYQSWWTASFMQELHVIGSSGGFDSTGEIIAEYYNVAASKHTGVRVFGQTGQDAYLLLTGGTNGWTIRNRDSQGSVLQIRTYSDNVVRWTLDRSGRVSLGGVNVPVASAVLDLSQATTMGFLPPVVTTTQKNAISSPAKGLVVFDTTLAKLCVYNGSAWETVTSS